MKRTIFVAWLAMLMVVAVPVWGQSDGPQELDSFTFPEGTTIRFPGDYAVVTLENQYEVNLELEDHPVTYYVDVFSADEIADTPINDIPDALDLSIFPVDESATLDYDAALDIQSNNVGVYFLRYEDDGFPGAIAAAYLPNGSILIVDAYGAYAGSAGEGIAIAMVTDAYLDNKDFTIDMTQVPLVPFTLEPVTNTDVNLHVFSDGTPLRFSTELTFEVNEGFNGDSLSIDNRVGEYYVDYYTNDLIDQYGWDTMPLAISNAFNPSDESLRIDPDAVASVTVNGVTVFYYRYDDLDVPGTIYGVQLAGGVLIIDAYGAHPGSVFEHYAAAMMFDVGGDSSLFEGVAVNLEAPANDGGDKNNSSDSGLGDVSN